MAAAPDGRVITGSQRLHHQAVARRRVRAHHPAHITPKKSTRWRCCRAERASSASRATAPRSCGRSTALFERTFGGQQRGDCVAALPDGVHFVVGLGYNEVRLYHVDGTLVHTFKGGHRRGDAVAVTPDGQHIISGSKDKLVMVWSVASKSLVSTCAGTPAAFARWRRCPTASASSAARRQAVRVWLLDGTLENTFSELHTDYVNALVALPDNQHALSGSWDDKTVKLFNVNDGAVLRAFKRHTAR